MIYKETMGEDIKFAFHHRFDYGRKLPVGKYSDPRIALIAIKQNILFDKLNELDEQIKRMYEDYIKHT